MKKTLTIIAIAFVIIGAVFITQYIGDTEQSIVDRPATTTSTSSDQQSQDESESIADNVESSGEPGKYITYTNDALTPEDNVIFFHASWCPTCRALESAIEANSDDIPSNLTIFKADYDSELELRRKYGVTIQHTLVLVDEDGEMIKKWSGSPDIDAILEEI